MSDLAGRYESRPLLRLLDAYVLDVLGALDERTEALARSVKDKTAAALGVEGETWQEVIETAMSIPPDAPDQLRIMWEQRVHAVIDEGGTPDVIEFAHAVVDSTFGAGLAQENRA